MSKMSAAPSTIGSYRVIRQLGEGGMGTVFEAVHETIERRVAIKVLHRDPGQSADSIHRFINEARAANLVSHPGLVQVTEFGSMPDGSGFLVMEYLQGETLAGRIKGARQLSPSETVHIGLQIASALSAAHKKGIIHRDLKPSNIMLIYDAAMPSGERVKIVDFGLAKLVNSSGMVKTQSQDVFGTPLYMSPEQCEGASRVDGKSDVYSLGCILYEMLSGTPPFVGDGMGSVIGMHMFKQAEPIRKLVPGLPDTLAKLVDQLLVKQKDKRPAMRDVRRALEAIVPGLPPPPRRREAEGSDAIDAAQVAAHEANSAVSKVASEARPRTLPKAWALVATGLLLALLLAWAATRTGGHSSPPATLATVAANQASPPAVASGAPAAEAAPRRVRVQIASQPAGAQIIRLPEQTRLGTTPWQAEVAAVDEPLRVRIELNRFATRELELSRQTDSVINVRMVPLPVSMANRPKLKKPIIHQSNAKPASPGTTATTHAKPLID